MCCNFDHCWSERGDGRVIKLVADITTPLALTISVMMSPSMSCTNVLAHYVGNVVLLRVVSPCVGGSKKPNTL